MCLRDTHVISYLEHLEEQPPYKKIATDGPILAASVDQFLVISHGREAISHGRESCGSTSSFS